jgi:hypothetical protein
MHNNNDQRPAGVDPAISKKIRQRFTFSLVCIALYGLFAFGYTDAGGFLREPISATLPISWAVVVFMFLIIAFVSLEFIFLQLNKPEAEK